MDRPPAQARKRAPWYFLTILFFFLIPFNALLLMAWKKMDHPAFWKAVGVVLVLGYAWSMLVTGQGWWSFNPETMLGLNVIPNLPLEEALFYPLGGALSIVLYAACSRDGDVSAGGRFWAGMLAVTLLIVGICAYSFLALGRQPYYVCSQLALFNLLALGLWPWVRGGLRVRPALLAVAGMTVVGFGWNWLAFTQGWWEYHAILGWFWPPEVPVDDWNFYLYAPLAAISLYEIFRKGGASS